MAMTAIMVLHPHQPSKQFSMFLITQAVYLPLMLTP